MLFSSVKIFVFVHFEAFKSVSFLSLFCKKFNTMRVVLHFSYTFEGLIILKTMTSGNHNSTLSGDFLRVITLLFFIFCGVVRGQLFSSVWYTTDNGLPQNSIKDIVEDKYGYLWLSTEQGIVRYDGRNFMTYRELGASNLHFRTFFGNIRKDSIMIFSEYNRDALLIRGRQPVKLSRYDADDGKTVGGQFYMYYRKRNLSELTPERAYMVSARTGTYLFSKGRIGFLQPGKPVQAVTGHFDPRNMGSVFAFGETVFVRDDRSREIMALTNGKIRKVPCPLFSEPGSMIYWQQVNGQVFLIRTDGVYRVLYDGSRLSAEKLLRYPGFGNHQFYSMYYDEQYRILYLGSLTKGLQVLRLLNFSCVKSTEPYRLPLVYSLLPYSRTEAVTSKGLVCDSAHVVKDLNFRTDHNSDSMLYDEQGNLICFKDSTLMYYRPPSFRPFRKRSFDFGIRYIFRSGGRYFISTGKNNRHLLIEFTDGSFSAIKRTYPMAGSVNCIRRYTEHRLLTGCQDGLYLLDQKNGSMKKVSGAAGIKNICRTRDGSFWAVSQADGFFLMDGLKLIRMPVDKNRNLASSHDILEDRKGFLWISTNNGLYKTHKANLYAYARNPGREVFYYRYSTRDGLHTNEFNGGGRPGATLLGDGHFVYPSMDGLVFFRPENVPSPLPSAGNIFVERVKTGKTVRTFTGMLSLERDFYRAEIFVDIPFFGNEDNLTVEGQMDSRLAKNWIPLEDNRTFVLEKLPSGNHVLHLRVRTGNGKYTYKEVPFYIQPYFYETAWFRMLLGLGAIVIIVVLSWKLLKKFSRQEDLIESVMHKLEQTEMELEKETGYQEDLFQAITHDITTPIRHLSNLSQVMLKTNNPDLTRKYFDSMYRSTEELYNLTVHLKEYREVFNSSNILAPEEYALRDLTESKIRLFGDMAGYNNVRIVNNVPPDLMISVSESIIGIIFHNLLDNAVKNTMQGMIIFDAEREGDTVTVRLSDTGTGMQAEQRDYYNALYESDDGKDMVFRHFGLGLHLVIRLIKKIDANIKFDTNRFQGTLVTIKIKNLCSEKF